MVIRGEYSSVAVTGEKEGPLALRRGYITPNVPKVSYRRCVTFAIHYIRAQIVRRVQPSVVCSCATWFGGSSEIFGF